MTSKNRVLFLNENPLPAVFDMGTIAGKELRLRSALPEIDEVHVIARSGKALATKRLKQTMLEEKIIVHLLPPWPYYLAFFPLLIYGLYWCRKLQPRSIEAESPLYSGPAAVILGKIFKIPSIVEVRASYHELIKYRLKWLPLKLKKIVVYSIISKTLESATAIIANSEYYQRLVGQFNRTVTVINPGVQYGPTFRHQQQTGIPITVGYMGRLVTEKGVNLLLEAVALLIHKQNIPKFRVEIAGTGPQAENLKRRAEQLEITNTVNFLGHVHNFSHLKHWDVLVNPCLAKAPLEMVNAEAAAAGIPVICFEQAGLPETVTHEVTGLKVYPHNAATLAESLKRIMSDQKLYARCVEMGPKLVAKKYDFTTQVAKMKKLYQHLSII